MKEDKIWLLIANKLTGEASKNDLLHLNEYLQANEDIAMQVKILSVLWKNLKPANEKVPACAIEKIMRKIKAV